MKISIDTLTIIERALRNRIDELKEKVAEGKEGRFGEALEIAKKDYGSVLITLANAKYNTPNETI